WIAAAAGVVVGAVGAITGGEYVVGSTWRGLDELLASEPGLADASSPGRMAINTALNFTFLGVALVLLSVRRLPGVRQVLGTLAAALAFGVFLGFVMSDVVLTGLWATSWTQTAPQTALCVMALGVAVVAADITVGWAQVFVAHGAGGRLMRRFTPIVVVMALVSAVLIRFLLGNEVLGPHASQLAIVFLAAVAFMVLLAAARRATATDDERLRDREALATSERMFRLAMAGAPQGMAVVGLDLGFVTVNESLCTMVGSDERWMLSHGVPDVLHPDTIGPDSAVRGQLLAGGNDYDIHEGRLVTATGECVWVEHSVALIRDEHDTPLFYVSQYQDITAARVAHSELVRQAHHDPLTGLINRGQLQDRVTDILHHQQRRNGVAGLLFCDIDNFKTINDTYGHGVGDDVLKAVARRASLMLRSDDVIARLGGDEFVVVLPTVYDMAAAVGVAQKIRAAVGAPLPIGDDNVKVTISVGITLAGPNVDANWLLSGADAALYKAKEAGRDRIATSMDDRIVVIEPC
ncbi:MAG: diguanylate cyclase, partial [Actinomycetes bacterium]